MSETHIFRNPVPITTGGIDYNVEEIEIDAPTGRDQNIFARLEAEYSKLLKVVSDGGQDGLKNFSPEQLVAVMESNRKAEAESESKETSETEESVEKRIETFLAQVKSSGFNLTTSYTILKELLTQKKSNTKMIADGQAPFKMNSGHWDHLPMGEIKRLLGFYIVNFIDGSN